MFDTHLQEQQLDWLLEYINAQIDSHGVTLRIHLDVIGILPIEYVFKLWKQIGMIPVYSEPNQFTSRILTFQEFVEFKLTNINN